MRISGQKEQVKKSEPGKRKKLWKKDKKVTIVNQSIGKIRNVPGTYQTPPTPVTQKYR